MDAYFNKALDITKGSKSQRQEDEVDDDEGLTQRHDSKEVLLNNEVKKTK